MLSNDAKLASTALTQLKVVERQLRRRIWRIPTAEAVTNPGPKVHNLRKGRRKHSTPTTRGLRWQTRVLKKIAKDTSGMPPEVEAAHLDYVRWLR